MISPYIVWTQLGILVISFLSDPTSAAFWFFLHQVLFLNHRDFERDHVRTLNGCVMPKLILDPHTLLSSSSSSWWLMAFRFRFRFRRGGMDSLVAPKFISLIWVCGSCFCFSFVTLGSGGPPPEVRSVKRASAIDAYSAF